MPEKEIRPLHEIAHEIQGDWMRISPHAKPYLNAMAELESVDQNYGWDTGKSVVLYFLANAQGWRGPVARKIKAELKEMVK